MNNPVLDHPDGTETITPPTQGDEDHKLSDGAQDFGRCPVCQKPLRPHDVNTGEPRTPPVGKGFASRAKCTGCGTILFYMGGKEWGVLLQSDLSDMDQALDRLGGF